MKKTYRFFGTILCIMLLIVGATACSSDDKDEGVSGTNSSIVGKWSCKYDAYGDRWEEPLIFQFDNNGTGYYWFSEEPFSYRYEFDYTVSGTKITLREEYDIETIRYELSSNGKSLTLYGLDDNDMAELHFTRVN